MKTPVIIAAHNEAAMIGRTLDKLNAKHVEPHVMANGCEDETAEIARSYGVRVYETPEAGKLPAIQTVLTALGDRALDPLLYVDADSYPILTSSWHRRMLQGLDPQEPSAASGPIVLDTFGITGLAYGGKYYIDTLRARRDDATRFRGANMATYFQREPVLKRILELPHIWPGEDCAMELALKSEGGSSRQVIHPGATVMTSARYVSPVIDIVTTGRAEVRKKSLRNYEMRAAEGSMTFGRYLKRQAKR